MNISGQSYGGRASLLGVIAWTSTGLIAVSMYPSLVDQLNHLWLLSGVVGLVSAVGLGEVVKREVTQQQNKLSAVLAEAQTDPLTGLANRRSLDARLEALTASGSNRQRACLVLIDVDHFKRLNDEYGHQAGDSVLRMLSQCLVEDLQPGELAARYGGEEFAILLPGYSLNDAFRYADEMRERIERQSCRYRGELLSVTISAGVADRTPVDTPESLFLRADEALYAAKNAGRNEVHVDGHAAVADAPAERAIAV